MITVEDIILDQDKRGISDLRNLVPRDFCKRSSDLILENPGKILITTGFYILTAGAAETDGPPGAIAIGNALEKLGYEVVYITDEYALDIMTECKSEKSRVIDFPIMDKTESEEYALELLSVENPSILLSIERCSAAQDDKYRNMRNLDITGSTARIDLLFSKHKTTIGIGDGGNEIGMGNVLDGVDKSEKLVSYPAISTVNELIISSVSNWGGYGLLSSLSMSTGENVLPTVDEDMQIIRRMVDMGAVDGFSGEQTYKVDGFSLEENAHVLQRLHDILD